MAITWSPETGQFQLDTAHTSYIMAVEQGYLCHLYWGRRLPPGDYTPMLARWGRSTHSALAEEGCPFSLDVQLLEYPGWGRGDMRTPALRVSNADGSDIVDLRYSGCEVQEGKARPAGLPAAYAEPGDRVQTLVIRLEDPWSHIHAELYYAVYEDEDILTRWVRVVNAGDTAAQLNGIMSACVEFDRMDYDVLSNHGSWGRERHVERAPLARGRFELFSERGASSHVHNPCLALTARDTAEEYGDAYGFLLVYSGSFSIVAEGGQYGTARVLLGLSRDHFGWRLEPGESFTAPEAVMTYAPDGLGGMSRRFHRFLRRRLCRSPYRERRVPVVINSWEACHFAIDEETLVRLARDACSLGAEVLVVDDGWFGHRDDDASSLGDWTVDRRKLPDGLPGLARRLAAFGCRLGIWVEPEMVSLDSDLYRAHPDWLLGIAGRPRSPARHQYVLDLTRAEVCDYVYRSVADLLATGVIVYVKWDCNRNLTEAGTAHLGPQRQAEVLHRYMLGLYGVLERLVTAFPDVLFEGCASGGGRFDAGMLHYMPQTWTSDNTDAISRLKIQYGTSLFYPLSTISAHVSASPNLQTGHVTPFATRLTVALTGAFGYELDPARLSEQEHALFRQGAEWYKTYGDRLVNGTYYRLRDPFDGNRSAWCIVSPERDWCLAAYVRVQAEVNGDEDRLPLRGLEPGAVYREVQSGTVCSAALLLNYGLKIPWDVGEYGSALWIWERCAGEES